jgi:carboxymethylenebutenolidase
MRVIPLLLFGSLLPTDSLAAAVQAPERLTGTDVSPAVWGLVEMPQGTGPHPAVIVLPGAAGWRPMHADVARILADSGFVALALDYYGETGGAAIRSDEKLEKWPRWKATVRNAVVYVRGLPSVLDRPVGLVGYSRGAFLAVSVAGSAAGVQAVVDFYGGGGGGTDALEQEVRDFPALLILHGDADEVVPVRYAYALRDAVVADGGDVEMHLYSGAGHAFIAPYASTYSQPAAQDAFSRTVEFLRRRLGN